MVPTSAADEAPTDAASECKDCLGDTMIELMDKYAEKEHCWLDSKHYMIVKLKIFNLIALIENFKKGIIGNNRVVSTDCEKKTDLPECESTDVNAKADCLMANLKSLIETFAEQEKCHGKSLTSLPMKIAIKLLSGSFVGWAKIHPDC